MKIIHNNRESEISQPKPRFNTVIAGMIAGLAFLPGCAGSLRVENPPEIREPAAAESRPMEPSVQECIRQAPTKDYLSVSRMLGICEVVEGDELLRLDFRSKIPGFMALVVDEIDGRGVDIDLRMEISASKSTSRPALWHVDYGETKTIGSREAGPAAANDPLQLPDMLIIRARRGESPDSAILEISKPDNLR